MLEKALQENTVAVKALTAAISNRGSGGGKPAGGKPATGATRKAPAATVKAVSDLVLTLVELKQRSTVVKLLKAQGATKVKDVSKAKLPLLYKKLTAALVAAKAAKEEAEAEDLTEELPDDDLNFEQDLGEEEEETVLDDDLDFLND